MGATRPEDDAMATDTIDPPAPPQTDTITLTLPAELVRKYRAAPAEKREAWDLMLEIRLRIMIDPPTRTLEEVMADVGREAAANGLTQEILDDILQEWDEERKAARAGREGGL